MQQLPLKETAVMRVPMSFEQQDLYDELLAELVNDVENETADGKELKGASVMMSLRKAANHHLLHRRQFNDSRLKYMAELLVEASCQPVIYMQFIYTSCPEKKNPQSSMNSFNRFKRTFTIFGTHYHHGTFYEKT